jgi:hypothetical protein
MESAEAVGIVESWSGWLAIDRVGKAMERSKAPSVGTLVTNFIAKVYPEWSS